MTAIRIVWRVRPGATLHREGEVLLVALPGRPGAQLPTGSEALAATLEALATGADKAQLRADANRHRVDTGQLLYCFALLRGFGLLEADIVGNDGLLATFVPHARDFDVPLPRRERSSVRLSRFSLLRAGDEGLRLENPEASCAVLVRSAALSGWLHEAAAPLAIDPAQEMGQALDVLTQARFLVEADTGETTAEATWEFHDRLFHRRTRRFDDLLGHGNTRRFDETFPTERATRPDYGGAVITLPPPQPAGGRGFYEVLDARRSGRAMSEEALGIEEVAALLHRATRVLPAGDVGPDQLRRPYPSAGGIHELEFYLAVDRCNGLASGFYHYGGDRHALVALPESETYARMMLEYCAQAWGQPGQLPQAMVVIASRMPRLARKYEGIAYRLSLLDAGVALQTLHLVATELGLVGAAAGSGDPRLFAAATGNTTWEETSIAEFGFGRPATLGGGR
jgi:SagB-type dehydrogenase family enzyme